MQLRKARPAPLEVQRRWARMLAEDPKAFFPEVIDPAGGGGGGTQGGGTPAAECPEGYEYVPLAPGEEGEDFGTSRCFNKQTGCRAGWAPDPKDPKKCRWEESGKPCGPGTSHVYNDNGDCVPREEVIAPGNVEEKKGLSFGAKVGIAAAVIVTLKWLSGMGKGRRR